MINKNWKNEGLKKWRTGKMRGVKWVNRLKTKK
jgi:hypothetical protein